MKRKRNGPKMDTHPLRSRTEERRINQDKGQPESSFSQKTSQGTQQLRQDQQILQVELKGKNKEYARSKSEINVLLADYIDLFDFAPVGYFILNPDGVIVRANQTGATLLGIERSRLTNRHLSVYLSDGSETLFNTFLKIVFEGKPIESCEVALSDKLCPSRLVQIEARLSQDRKQCRLIMIDITNRRRMMAELAERTRQLEDANKELESFSYSVSHDLRVPLRAIDGYCRMILKKANDQFSQDMIDHFEVIRESTKQMNHLIDNLLLFVRLARPKPSVSMLDMRDLFHNAWQEVQHDNPERAMTLKIDKLPPGWGDRSLMLQVCINLLSNAAKFTKLRDVALIEAGGYHEGDECIYFVKDNGVGFDMAYCDKLFGVFQRLHSKTEYEGTGIGLALVKRIVVRHGGRVWAEGKVNEGASFYFTLPDWHQ